MVNFQDAFWGDDSRGFEALLTRLRYGRKTSEAFRDFINQRIAIEEEYAKKLQKLSKFVFPSESAGEKDADYPEVHLGNVLQAMLRNANEVAGENMKLAEKLRMQIVKPLENLLEDQVKVKHQYKRDMNIVVKKKANQHAAVCKAREKYYSKCKDKTMMVDAPNAGLSGKEFEKYENKLKKMTDAEQAADASYYAQVSKLHDLHDQWKQQMTVATEAFQRVEETRLQDTRGFMLGYCDVMNGNLQEHLQLCADLQESIRTCTPEGELEYFIRKKATGTNIPAPPRYINYYTDSPLNAPISGLQSMRIDSPQAHRSADYESSTSTISRSSSYYSSNGVASNGARGIRSNNIFSMPAKAQSTESIDSINSSVLFRVKALYEYSAQNSDELSFCAGETMKVTSTEEDPWWFGQTEGRSGAIGIFPSNFVQKI